MGCSKKDPYPTQRGNFRHPGRRNYLKNVLNLYRMSGEGEGALLISSVGGYGSFLERPNDIKINMVLNGAYHNLQQNS